MKIALYPNFDKSNALSCALSCAEILHRYGAEVFVRESHREQFSSADFVKIGKMSEIASKCDIIIAIGGDGTILKCSGYHNFDANNLSFPYISDKFSDRSASYRE